LALQLWVPKLLVPLILAQQSSALQLLAQQSSALQLLALQLLALQLLVSMWLVQRSGCLLAARSELRLEAKRSATGSVSASEWSAQLWAPLSGQ
jgi:hypothetical protein